MRKILVVDDDEHLRMVLRETMLSAGYEVSVAESGNQAMEILKNEPFDLIISDLMMPGLKGNELLTQAKKLYPEIGFFLVSAYGTIETAVDAMKTGAYDFITKPFSISQIESRVEHYFKYVDLQEENKNLKERLKSHQLQTKLIGNTPPMQELLYNVEVVAMSDAPVFIRGESGTGKELIAEAIHDNSSRAGKPFLKVNCAAVPETLFESTLFGHEKGAFSGAYKAQKGLFEECDGGTLLLDEISEIPYNMQAKMLRVIQEMRVTRVGSTVEMPVDVRVVASSNRDIEVLIEEGKFREDLYFRLNVFPVHVPSLQERIGDLPLIADHFLTVYAQKYKIEKKELLPETLDRLMTYSWPGNIRQLEHVIERAVLYSAKAENILDEHVVLDRKEKESIVKEMAVQSGTVQTLAEMEKQMIFSALEKTKNHKTKAAELLGITVRTLRNKLHQFEEEKQRTANPS